MAHEGEFASSGKLRKRELLCHRVVNAPFLQRCMRIDCTALDGGSMVQAMAEEHSWEHQEHEHQERDHHESGAVEYVRLGLMALVIVASLTGWWRQRKAVRCPGR